MASIGTLPLENDKGSTSVGFWLKSDAISDVRRPLDNGWTVAIDAKQDCVAATIKEISVLHELIERGRDAIEETLDLLCFVRNEPTELKPESGDMFVLSTENGRRVFTYRTVLPWEVRVGSLSITVTDANGNVRPPTKTKITWQTDRASV